MILLAALALVAIITAAGIAWLVTAWVYRRRIDRLSDDLDVAREAVEDAVDQLREFGDRLDIEPPDTDEMTLRAIARDLASEAGFTRRLDRFNARHAGTDLPRT